MDLSPANFPEAPTDADHLDESAVQAGRPSYPAIVDDYSVENSGCTPAILSSELHKYSPHASHGGGGNGKGTSSDMSYCSSFESLVVAMLKISSGGCNGNGGPVIDQEISKSTGVSRVHDEDVDITISEQVISSKKTGIGDMPAVCCAQENVASPKNKVMPTTVLNNLATTSTIEVPECCCAPACTRDGCVEEEPVDSPKPCDEYGTVLPSTVLRCSQEHWGDKFRNDALTGLVDDPIEVQQRTADRTAVNGHVASCDNLNCEIDTVYCNIAMKSGPKLKFKCTNGEAACASAARNECAPSAHCDSVVKDTIEVSQEDENKFALLPLDFTEGGGAAMLDDRGHLAIPGMANDGKCLPDRVGNCTSLEGKYLLMGAVVHVAALLVGTVATDSDAVKDLVIGEASKDVFIGRDTPNCETGGHGLEDPLKMHSAGIFIGCRNGPFLVYVHHSTLFESQGWSKNVAYEKGTLADTCREGKGHAAGVGSWTLGGDHSSSDSLDGQLLTTLFKTA